MQIRRLCNRIPEVSKGEDYVKKGWDLPNIYLYLVSFATLMMIIIGTVQLIQATTDFIYPPPSYYPDKTELIMRNKAQNIEMSPQQLEEQVKLEREKWERSQRYNSIRRLINGFSLLVVATPIYLYHWRKIQSNGTTNE